MNYSKEKNKEQELRRQQCVSCIIAEIKQKTLILCNCNNNINA